MSRPIPSKLPPTPPTEENTGMTKLGAASKRKRTSSGDGERGKLVLEVVEPAVDEPEEKVNKSTLICYFGSTLETVRKVHIRKIWI